MRIKLIPNYTLKEEKKHDNNMLSLIKFAGLHYGQLRWLLITNFAYDNFRLAQLPFILPIYVRVIEVSKDTIQ